MDIHGKSVDMDMDMDGKFHIHGKPGSHVVTCHGIRINVLCFNASLSGVLTRFIMNRRLS